MNDLLNKLLNEDFRYEVNSDGSYHVWHVSLDYNFPSISLEEIRIGLDSFDWDDRFEF